MISLIRHIFYDIKVKLEAKGPFYRSPDHQQQIVQPGFK